MRTSTSAAARLATLAAALALAGTAHAGLLGGGGGLGVGGGLQGDIGGSMTGALERPAVVDTVRGRSQQAIEKTRDTAQAQSRQRASTRPLAARPASRGPEHGDSAPRRRQRNAATAA